MAANFDFGIDAVLASSQTSSIDEEDMAKMEAEAVPESTSRATKSGVKKFLAWTRKRNIEVDFLTVTSEQLAPILRRFYAEVKKEDGKALSPSSLVGIRASINRYLTTSPFYRDFNIVSGREFIIANKMFETKNKLYYKGNNPKPKHKPVIEKADMEKLGVYFKKYNENAVVLSEAVWFLLCFHFGRRGREGWAELKKNHFSVVESPEGVYVDCSKTEVIKNVQGGHKQSQQDYSSNRMYGDSAVIFQFFLSKLNPKCERLFQYPVNSFLASAQVWFDNKPIGKNSLCNMMHRISEKAALSQIYTCHSVRASCITALFQAGVPAEQIISITKHKSTSSLKHYISDMSTEQKQDCSSILSGSLFGTEENNREIEIVPRQSKNVPTSVAPTMVPSNGVGGSSGCLAKYSEIFGSCSFQNCEIKFS